MSIKKDKNGLTQDDYVSYFNTAYESLSKSLSLLEKNILEDVKINKNIKKKIIDNSMTQQLHVSTKFGGTLVINQFVEKVLPHKPQIDSGDVEYFLEFSKESSDSDFGGEENSLCIGYIWDSISTENKNVIIQTLQLLCTYAELYNNF